jgi:hypothetical protein
VDNELNLQSFQHLTKPLQSKKNSITRQPSFCITQPKNELLYTEAPQPAQARVTKPGLLLQKKVAPVPVTRAQQKTTK